MNNEELQTIIKRAKAYATKRGHSGLADDFAQEAALRLFAGRKATLEQLFIDFLRTEQGHARTAGGRARKAERVYGTRLDAPVSDGSDVLAHELIASPERDPEPRRIPVSSSRLLNERQRLAAELILNEEDLTSQVATHLGVTAGRVSQLMNPVKTLGTFEVMKEEMWEKVMETEGGSEIEIDWITL